METRLLGALVNSTRGVSLPPAEMDPFMTRLVTLCIASAPPAADTYLARISSAVGAAAPELAGAGAGGLSGVPSVSRTGGTATGRAEPRWQEKQVTWRRPPKASLLMAAVMAIMLRAVFLAPLSSASNLPGTWQKAQ